MSKMPAGNFKTNTHIQSRTSELAGILPKINAELRIAKLAVGAVQADKPDKNEYADSWFKNERGFYCLDEKEHEELNHIFLDSNSELDRTFSAQLDGWQQWQETVRQDTQFFLDVLSGAIKSKLCDASVDKTIEESYRLDAHLFESPKWRDGLISEEEPDLNDAEVNLASMQPRWRDDLEVQLEAMYRREFAERHVFFEGDDFLVLTPNQAKEVARKLGGKKERVVYMFARILSLSDLYEDPIERRNWTIRVAKEIKKHSKEMSKR